MSIEAAEHLKKAWTDKYVIVQEEVPELRRFVGLTGTVKTVNMNCRALVQFDSPEDISWYDIDPAYLKAVDAPLPKKPDAKSQQKAAPKEAPAKPAPAKKPGLSPLEQARQQGAAAAGKAPSAQPTAGTQPVAATGAKKPSPLELARMQGAAGAGAAAKADIAPKAEVATPTAEGKKLSPLELARRQGAAGSGSTANVEAAPMPPVAKPQAAGKKLSPLELARQQGAAGSANAVSTDGNGSDQDQSVEEVPAQASAPPVQQRPAPTGGKKLSPLEQARLQGPFKGQ